MKRKFNKNYLKTPDLLVIIVSSFLLLLTYNYSKLIFKEDLKVGFLNAKAISNKFNCRLKSQNKICIQNVIKDINSEKSILFLGNSQTGAINNFTDKDADFISLLNENSFLKKSNITIRSFWMPNASIKEFSIINDFLNKCSSIPEILILPTFLDDTRENTIREFIQEFDKEFCKKGIETLSTQETIEGNLVKIEKFIKKRYKFLNNLQSLNTRFRTDLYKIRNFIFMIKPNSIRSIKSSSYFSNINAYEKILASRDKSNLKTIVYIPPLLYANSKNKIPYIQKEYKSFKNRIKKMCYEYNCFFYNLESTIEDNLWGSKSSTNIINSSNEIDFMHFTGEGHIKLSNEFQLIIKDHIGNNLNKL